MADIKKTLSLFRKPLASDGKTPFREAMQQRLDEQASKQRQEDAFRTNYDGEIATQGPSESPLGGLTASALEWLGMGGKQAYDTGQKAETLAEMLTPYGTLEALDEGDLEGAAMAAVGGPAKAGRGALARLIKRPEQELSGVFDYSAKYPPRDLGVERFRPKKVPERTTELLARDDVFEKMLEGVEAGRPVADWYETGALRKSFEDQLGPEEGLGRFDQFIDSVAATSPRSKVGENVRNASYYYGKAQPEPGRNSLPEFSELPEKAPYPYGHLAQNLHRMNVEKTVFPGGEGFDFKKNPKPTAFAANLKGDPSVATVDTHAFRAPAIMGEDPRFLSTSFISKKGDVPRNIQKEVLEGKMPLDDALGQGGVWASKPLPTEYAAFEDLYKKLGDEAGMSPREAQAASWVGHGDRTGLESAPKSFMDFVEERILLTARERGMDPRDVWRMVVSGKKPLLGIGGAGIGAGALQGGEEQ